MPGRDQTGPAGQGPKTGRGVGVCVGVSGLEEANVAPGRGQMVNPWQGGWRGCGRRGRGGFGMGLGRGRGRGFGMGR